MKENNIKINALRILKKTVFTEALKYLLVGGLCTLLDFGLLYVITNFCGINYILSSMMSFMLGTVLNYYLCTIWIFKIRVIKKRQHELLYYFIITGVGLGVNTLLIWGFTYFFAFYFMLSKLLATFVTYWWNFGARKYFLHTTK